MMIASLFLVVVAVVSAQEPAEEVSCTYWCRNPETQDYVCCDDGNPWFKGGNAGPPIQDDYTILDSASVEASDAGSSGCRYFCHYNDQVYCCDNGEGPREYFIPQYHVPHYIGQPPVVETLHPNYIIQPVSGYNSIPQMNPYGLFRNTFRIVDSDTEEETRDSGSFPSDIRRFIDHVINSPTLGRLAFDSLLGMIPSASTDEHAETSKSSDESNHDKRQTDDNDGLSPSPSSNTNFIDHVIRSPMLGTLALDSLMSMIPSESTEEHAETPKSLDESNPSPSSNSIFNSISTLEDLSSLFFGNGEDDSETEGTGQNERRQVDIPILSSVPLVNSFAISPAIENFNSGVPLVPSNKSLASPNLSNIGSLSNGIPLVPADDSSASPNPFDTNSASNGVPLLNASIIHTLDASQKLPHVQGVPLPITQGQANTAFVMQHVLQQPEMANAVILSQHSPNPPITSTKGSPQGNTEEIEPEIETEAPLTIIANENNLKTNDVLESKEELSEVSTLPIIASADIINDVLELTEELSDVSTLPKISAEVILDTDETHAPLLPIHSDTSSTLSNSGQLTQIDNPSTLEMYGTLPVNTVPQKRPQSQQGHGSIPYSTNQHSLSPHYSQKSGYPMPSIKYYRRPNRPFVHHQTHNTYPKPTYNPNTYPKPTYIPKTYPKPTYTPNTFPKPTYHPNTYPKPIYNPNTYPKPTYNPSSIRFTPDFILTGSDTPGLPSTGLIPPSNDLQFFSHIPSSISDTLVAPPKETISLDSSEDIVTDDVLDLVMNINKATCLCLENGERRSDTSCPCSIEDLVVVFPPTPLQPYLLLPLSKSESFMEKFHFDKIEKSLNEEELITSPSEYSIQKVSPENKQIEIINKNSETYPEQKEQNFLEVLKRFHNLSNQIQRRSLADILGNSSKLPKVEFDNDQIEEIINSESSKPSPLISSQT